MLNIDIAAIVMAITGLLGLAGAGIRFLWNKIEARFAVIDGKLAECEKRESAGKDRSASHVAVIELLWGEVERLSPEGSRAIVRAGKLLSDLKKEAH